ncbi:hypothetical protein ABE073_04580 [Lederbergia citrisecunda]|uniref:hypothetical protein n=1 Tax=Lederbergia citrisecunda TaxID=2833583 RepID=UPI003D2693F1
MVYTLENSYECKAKEVSEFVLEHLFGGVYEVTKDRFDGSVGTVVYEDRVAQMLNDFPKVTVLNRNNIYSIFDIFD